MKRRDDNQKNLLPGFLVVGFLLFSLTGCDSSERYETSSELLSGDSWLDGGQRVLFPASYWRKKAFHFGQIVSEERVRYREATQAYHEALKARRQEIFSAVENAKKTGGDASQARRAVVLRFRQTLDPLRKLSKDHGRAMSQAMEHMQKSRKNLERAMTGESQTSAQ